MIISEGNITLSKPFAEDMDLENNITILTNEELNWFLSNFSFKKIVWNKGSERGLYFRLLASDILKPFLVAIDYFNEIMTMYDGEWTMDEKANDKYFMLNYKRGFKVAIIDLTIAKELTISPEPWIDTYHAFTVAKFITLVLILQYCGWHIGEWRQEEQ